MEVILVFVKDYEVDGEFQVWNVYSEYTSDEEIERDIQEAKDNGTMGEDAEYVSERWNVWNS